MNDQDLLILILVAIYLSECVSWVPITDYVVQFRRLRSGTFHRPGRGLGNDRGRFFLSRVLPFQAGTFVTPGQAKSFDAKAAEQRWQEYRSVARPVALAANATFLLLFVALPVAWRTLGGESLVLLAVFCLTLASGLLTAVLHFRAHRPLCGTPAYGHHPVFGPLARSIRTGKGQGLAPHRIEKDFFPLPLRSGDGRSRRHQC